MAHISWPWCEECNAVMGRMYAAVGYERQRWQSYVDVTPGPPAYILKQVVGNAISLCGHDRLMFGTDNRVKENLGGIKDRINQFMRLFGELGLDEKKIERIMSGTADELFPVKR